jgi:hypothetical protein
MALRALLTATEKGAADVRGTLLVLCDPLLPVLRCPPELPLRLCVVVERPPPLPPFLPAKAAVAPPINKDKARIPERSVFMP